MSTEQIGKLHKFNVAATVVTFNRKAQLEECLEALLAQTTSLDEIIVVDNASIDGTDLMITSKFPQVTYFRLKENIGGAGGYHEGIKLAYEKGFDWIWLMDDDAIPAIDALEQLIRSDLFQQDDVCVLTSALLYPDGRIWTFYRRIFNSKKIDEIPVGIEYYNREYFEVDAASFMGMLVSRYVIKLIGFPEKDFFIDYDDLEYCFRIRDIKGRIFTIPKSKIIHNDLKVIDPNFRDNYLSWRYYYQNRNKLYTYRKYLDLGIKYYVKLFFGTVVTQAWVLLRTHERRLASSRILWFSLMDGLRGKLGKVIEPQK
jgi:rhamnopyranosyl-N-acetylglucosaminyl-diphospho-decaprenol beta-1,3/1,4-galactofuranosyltransferase